MKTFLTSIGLYKEFKVETIFSIEAFLDNLSRVVDNASLCWFYDWLDIFLNNKNELKGRISRNGFIVRKKWHFFDACSNLAKAKGRFIEDDGRMVVCIQVTGFNWFIVLFALPSIFLSFFVIVFENGINDSPAILLLPILFILLPYLFVRISVSRLYEILKKKIN